MAIPRVVLTIKTVCAMQYKSYENKAKADQNRPYFGEHKALRLGCYIAGRASKEILEKLNDLNSRKLIGVNGLSSVTPSNLSLV